MPILPDCEANIARLALFAQQTGMGGFRPPSPAWYAHASKDLMLKGIQQYIFLLFHLEELLKLYVNLFYRFCVTLLFLEIFEQKKSQIS
jgi:hypothetical protein